MATISIKDAAGATQNVEAPLAPGRAAATSSRPVALSNEDYAAIDGIEALLTTLAGAVKAEDVPSANADALLIVGAMRQGTPANTSGTDGDYEPLRTSNGLLWMQMGAALPAGTNTIGNVGGPAAHDAASSGNPLLVGGYASAAAPADVSADGDAVRAWLLRNGAQAVAQVPGLTGFTSAASATRPANTTAYAAGDVVGASAATWTFANIGPTGGGKVLITGASFRIDTSAVLSGETSYRLHLYSVTPPSALADNAAFDLPSGDRASYLGFINLGYTEDLGSTLYTELTGLNKQINLASSSLYGYLVTAGGYTPNSAQVYNITLQSVSV